MNETAGRGEYVTYREHITAKEEAAKVLSAIQLEQAAQRAALMHLPEDVRRLTDAVNAKMLSVTPPPVANDALVQAITSQSLAIQRTLDTLAKQPPATTLTEALKLLNTPPPGSSGKTWALVGVLATVAAFLAYRAFSG